ncbi:hypothetical protein [Paraburkholderia sp. BR13444]
MGEIDEQGEMESTAQANGTARRDRSQLSIGSTRSEKLDDVDLLVAG